MYTCTSAGTSIHCPLPRLWVGNNMSLQCELWILETVIPFSLKRLSQMEFLLCDLYKGNNQIHGTQWIQSLKGVCQEFSLMCAFQMFKATIHRDPKLFISGWLWVSAESWTMSSCHISYMDVLVTSMPPTLFTVNFITPSSSLLWSSRTLSFDFECVLSYFYAAITEVIVMYIDWPVASGKKIVADLWCFRGEVLS